MNFWPRVTGRLDPTNPYNLQETSDSQWALGAEQPVHLDHAWSLWRVFLLTGELSWSLAVSHLLEVIEHLSGKGAHFRSLRDPIDTSRPQGMFSLQVLGAVAQLECALISERTKAGIRAAKAKGRLSV